LAGRELFFGGSVSTGCRGIFCLKIKGEYKKMENTLKQDFREFAMGRVGNVSASLGNKKIEAADEDAEKALENFLQSVELSEENKLKLSRYLDRTLAARAEEVLEAWMRGWGDAMGVILGNMS
ncbi:MAG: hypothetical protein ACOX7L_02895, partial [Dethiobacteria bacterium]|jgi:uncharacterized glyoxalase superfamily protein PhnB